MTTVELVGLIAIGFEYVVGIALNMDILLVYMRNLKNGLSFASSDKVHLTKVLVNVFLQLTMVAEHIIVHFWPLLFFTNEDLLWILVILNVLTMYSYWLTAVLCVYYCTNITICGHRIFVWMKRSLSSYLHHLLLVSGLGSVAVCFPGFWFCRLNHFGNSTYDFTVIQGTFLQNGTYTIICVILGCFLPFAIALVSTAFTSWSLINHMWTMKQNNPGFTRSKFQTQINATRTMVLFLLISVIYSVTQFSLFTIPTSVSDAIVITIWIVTISYPISEAIIIIQSNCKFRKTLLGKFLRPKN
ncbi:taste receptor type 2 member 40-like [Leptodactylus fuscus]|uniref:taste receptor type 2 member 40-like n=1 Tax=Leptodactylus fuscus TaxID=238119 RepID=UPI003F4E777F